MSTSHPKSPVANPPTNRKDSGAKKKTAPKICGNDLVAQNLRTKLASGGTSSDSDSSTSSGLDNDFSKEERKVLKGVPLFENVSQIIFEGSPSEHNGFMDNLLIEYRTLLVTEIKEEESEDEYMDRMKKEFPVMEFLDFSVDKPENVKRFCSRWLCTGRSKSESASDYLARVQAAGVPCACFKTEHVEEKHGAYMFLLRVRFINKGRFTKKMVQQVRDMMNEESAKSSQTTQKDNGDVSNDESGQLSPTEKEDEEASPIRKEMEQQQQQEPSPNPEQVHAITNPESDTGANEEVPEVPPTAQAEPPETDTPNGAVDPTAEAEPPETDNQNGAVNPTAEAAPPDATTEPPLPTATDNEQFVAALLDTPTDGGAM